MNRTNWKSPLKLKPRKEGTYELIREVLPPGTPVMMSSFRNALLGGQRAAQHQITFPTPTTWHKLTYEGGVWMTDYPVEQRQIDELLKGMRGRVLVGGLGLGYAAHRLKRMRAVWQVVVVEKSYEVLNLCGMHAQAGTAGPKVELVHADLFDYLRNYKGSAFDFAFYDIWQSDGEHTFFKVVCPLLQLSKDKVKHPPRCWNEDVMRGQLHLGLQQRLITATFELTPPEGDLTELARAMVRPKHLPPLWEELKPGVLEHYDPIWHNWSVPFFQWWKETQPDEETLQVAIRHYAAGYGKAGFESY